jgi:hypothetical protein
MLVGIDCSFPKSHYTLFLDSRFKSYEVLKISTKIRACSQPQSSGMHVANSAQNCQNLPKFAQRRIFEIPPKIEILVFFKNKNFYT